MRVRNFKYLWIHQKNRRSSGSDRTREEDDSLGQMAEEHEMREVPGMQHRVCRCSVLCGPLDITRALTDVTSLMLICIKNVLGVNEASFTLTSPSLFSLDVFIAE